jgi:hypothetical protein
MKMILMFYCGEKNNDKLTNEQAKRSKLKETTTANGDGECVEFRESFV